VHPLGFVTGASTERARREEDAPLALGDSERADELAPTGAWTVLSAAYRLPWT